MSIDNSIKDFDALAKEEQRQPIRVGGRVFPLPRIPAIASMLHTRHYYGTLVNPDGSKQDETDMKLQCLVAVLNAGIPEHEWIDEKWVGENVPGSVYYDLVDYVLDPLYESKRRKQERNQMTMVDVLTPSLVAIVKEEIEKALPKRSGNKSPST